MVPAKLTNQTPFGCMRYVMFDSFAITMLTVQLLWRKHFKTCLLICLFPCSDIPRKTLANISKHHILPTYQPGQRNRWETIVFTFLSRFFEIFESTLLKYLTRWSTLLAEVPYSLKYLTRGYLPFFFSVGSILLMRSYCEIERQGSLTLILYASSVYAWLARPREIFKWVFVFSKL